MKLTQEFYLSLLLWISLALYMIALIPQILLNKRLKSVAGLSDAYLYAFFLGYITELYYVICLDFHPAYTWFVPAAAVCIFIIVFQRFYYHSPRSTPKLSLLYIMTTLIALAILPLAKTHPQKLGHAMGWLATSLWSTYQIPQIIKNITRRSVHGFSLGLTLMFGCASACECIGAIVLGLPTQTMINGVRGLCMFAIFSFQFLYYGTDPKPRK